MQVAALSMAGINLESIDRYRADLSNLLKSCGADLVVLPAYSALVLGLGSGAFMPGPDMAGTLYMFSAANEDWNNLFFELHGDLAGKHKIFLAAGTTVEKEAGCFYHSAYCFNPAGELCCRQRQTHLTRVERELDFSRGEELHIFKLQGPKSDGLEAGLVVGNDVRHPEVSRIFALRGADLLLHSGALAAGFNCWTQAAGMWAQVQQNQFWAVEAQLSGNIAGTLFGAASAVIGPCEITPGQSGYLASGYPLSPVVTAALNEKDRQSIIKDYPLLQMLNRQAYNDLLAF